MRQHRRWSTAIVALTLTAGSAFVGLVGTAGAGKVSGEPIKFGYIDPAPGASAQPSVVEALQLYVDDWNKRGGFHGQPIEVIVKIPSALDPAVYVADVNELVEDDGVAGLLSAGQCTFTISALRATQIPTLGATETCGADEPFYFASGGRAPTLPLFEYAIDEGSKAFGVLYPGAIPQLKSGFVDPLNDYLANHPEVETKVVEVPTPFPQTAADFDAAIAKMKEDGVDALFAAVQTDGAALAMQQARVQGFGPHDGIKWMFGPNLYDPSAASELPDLDGTYALSEGYPWEDTTNPQVKKMIKVTKGKLGTRDGFAESGYKLAATLEASLKGLEGEVTSKSLQAYWASLHKLKIPLTPTTADFADIFKNPAGGVVIQIKDGAFITASDFIVIPAKEFNP